jgi:hypothetical protein
MAVRGYSPATIMKVTCLKYDWELAPLEDWGPEETKRRLHQPLDEALDGPAPADAFAADEPSGAPRPDTAGDTPAICAAQQIDEALHASLAEAPAPAAEELRRALLDGAAAGEYGFIRAFLELADPAPDDPAQPQPQYTRQQMWGRIVGGRTPADLMKVTRLDRQWKLVPRDDCDEQERQRRMHTGIRFAMNSKFTRIETHTQANPVTITDEEARP